ncbi:MAG: RNA methyltransferase [Casimicrobiaceae bacterium]
MQRITSAHNPRLREAARLFASSRDRRKHGKCVLEGEHLIGVYADRIGAPEVLIVAEDALQRPGVDALAQRFATKTLVVPIRVFADLAALPIGVGIIAVVDAPRGVAEGPSDFCLLLEDVQDPGNVGTMLRTAAAAGVARVVLSKHCAFAWSPKVLRAGQGAHFLLAIEESVDLVAWTHDFVATEGRVVAAVASGGASLFGSDLGRRIAIAIGNEGAGLSAPLLAAVSDRLTIPLPGGMESLNASAAAAVCLFECVRQRLAPRG